MRSLWLASAAFCMTAGVALAQTSSSAPAPTGAPSAAAASPAPGASPGNMAPSSTMSGTGSASAAGSSASTGMSSGASSPGMTASAPPAPTMSTGGVTSGSPSVAASAPHYNGQDAVSPPAGQASSQGSSGGAMTNGGGMAPAAPQHVAAAHSYTAGSYHGAMGGGGTAGLPENASPNTYLKIAAKAIKQHNKMLADEALSHAETRMLDRAVPASTGATVDNSPGVTAIEQARQALNAGDYQTAASDTRMAMDRHDMMGGEKMKRSTQSMNETGASDMSGGSTMGAPQGRPMGASGAGIGASGTGMGAGGSDLGSSGSGVGSPASGIGPAGPGPMGSGPMGASGTGATGGSAQ